MSEKPKFVIDICLGEKILLDFLIGRNWNVIPLKEISNTDSPDDKWLLLAGQNGLSVLTLDKFKPNEKMVIKNSNVKTFVLRSKK